MNRSCYIGRSLEELKIMQKHTFKEACKDLAFLITYLGLCVAVPNPIISGILSAEIIKAMSNTLMLFDYMNNCSFYFENSKEYIAMQHSYRIVLEELVKLFEKLNWNNEMQLFSGYSYMLRKGYLSRKHKFYYSDDADWCHDFFCSNVMLGVGDRKHINGMFTDLLSTKGCLACNLAVFVKGNEKFTFLCSEFTSILEKADKEVKEVRNSPEDKKRSRVGKK